MCVMCRLHASNVQMLDVIIDMIAAHAPNGRDMTDGWTVVQTKAIDAEGNFHATDLLVLVDANTNQAITPIGNGDLEQAKLLFPMLMMVAHTIGIDNLSYEQREYVEEMKRQINTGVYLKDAQHEPKDN